jgi:hypothetical protein
MFTLDVKRYSTSKSKKTHYEPERRYGGDCDHRWVIHFVRELLLLGDEVRTMICIAKGQ